MEATEINPEYLRRLDRRYPDILKHIEEENPVIYLEGVYYCCLSKSNPHAGMFGSGITEQDALEDWEKNFHKSLVHAQN